MCGIAGVVGPLRDGAPDLAEARRMIATLAHRGPDGVRVESVDGAALAHARLSIIDLEGGWQPLHAAGSTVIGNGEIYNYVELIEQFGLTGKLSTRSDFEPLLHIYAQEGKRVFTRLRGMYAFCLVGGDGRTWLVRDPFGIKPLYIAGARFASEPRALGPVRLGQEAAEELLALNYIVTSPLRAPPGTRASFQAAGEGGFGDEDGSAGTAVRVREATFAPSEAQRPNSRPLLHPLRETEALQALDAVLEDSVRVHQRSDVPYGLFLSGGVDSAAVATLMAKRAAS